MKKGWLVFLVLLAAAALTLSGILLGKFSREEKIFQEQAALNGIVYDEAFLEEAAKLPGIQSVKPVVSLPVQLKVGEYSVETELLGVELMDPSLSGREGFRYRFRENAGASDRKGGALRLVDPAAMQSQKSASASCSKSIRSFRSPPPFRTGRNRPFPAGRQRS